MKKSGNKFSSSTKIYQRNSQFLPPDFYFVKSILYSLIEDLLDVDPLVVADANAFLEEMAAVKLDELYDIQTLPEFLVSYFKINPLKLVRLIREKAEFFSDSLRGKSKLLINFQLQLFDFIIS